MKRLTIISICIATAISALADNPKIDRKALMERNSPIVTAIDSLSSLTVGNGSFAVTVDATGLQSYPERYVNGIPLNAMSDWAWHSFPNTKGLRHEETESALDLGHGHEETYAVEYKTEGRNKEATNYFRINPHRLSLGTVGLLFTDNEGEKTDCSRLQDIHQRLDLWNGIIESSYKVKGTGVKVYTGSLTNESGFYAKIESPLIAKGKAKVQITFSYPTGKHSDDGNDWSKPQLHKSTIIAQTSNSALIERRLDSTLYYMEVAWEGKAELKATGIHEFQLSSKDKALSFRIVYSPTRKNYEEYNFNEAMSATSAFWHDYWQQGAAVDFSYCTDSRAKELERRVVLSQYLTAVNCANQIPPQETGLTYNSWFGRPHLEMTFWHGVHFALWNRPKALRTMLQWYNDKASPIARKIAERQGFEGLRWMKMTDPEAGEAPSNTGSFLLWQQPHYIYMAEEMYRANPSSETLALYADNVEATAEFIADFAKSCTPKNGGRIKLFGATAMQESMSKDFSFNHPFEQAYWHYALSVAQQWRERQGKERNEEWDSIIENLAPLTLIDGIYQSGEPLDSVAEFALKSRSDHPAVLGVAGIFPSSPLYEREAMEKTLEWVMDNWNWATTWGWDYGMVAMCATSVGRPDIALEALLADKPKNTYLINGHNYQEPKRLRLYLPGNGALLTAIAMMCAGWDGIDNNNPGFPHDGKWDVRWEGLRKLQSYWQQLPDRSETLKTIVKANNYFMKKYADPTTPSYVGKMRPSNIWTRGVYYEGLMALHEICPKKEYYDYAYKWGEYHKWGFRSGNTTRNADDQCCAQTYIDLYRLNQDTALIENIKANMGMMLTTPQVNDWWWIDAIQMAMPIYAKMGALTGDARYFDKMWQMYQYTRNQHGEAGLFNPKEGLWWRDQDFDPPYKEPNGKNCYWSRGNGWVYAALVRVLKEIPANEPHRQDYIDDFLTMSKALVKCQREDGFWNCSLHDESNYGGKEMSGTALFVYGMAYGVRTGLLDSATYLPILTKAWNAIVKDCVHDNGQLGYVQGTGKEPKDSQPTTYDKIPDFEDFGTGCFLLAGAEVYKLR